mmetsp:Transcript_59611/g.146388  ORF Transcript_59611/g.146388 Transcript_59611/m.146388 type:complete len:506 (+) Transcript_59611:159-1676(+)
MTLLSRLRGAAIAGAGLHSKFGAVKAVSAQLPVMASSLPRQVDVVIVGCGAAGLGACRRLLEAKKKVVILEASHRMGGRVENREVFGENEKPLEMGAQWMHGIEGHPLYDYAVEHGLMDALEKDGDGNYVYPSLEMTALTARREGGDEVQHDLLSEVGRVFDDIEEECALQGETATEETSLDFFERRFRQHVESQTRYSPEDMWLVFSYFVNRQACIDGGELIEQSPAQYFHYKELEGPLLVSVPGGYIRLLKHIADRLPEGCLRTSTPVEAVDWSGPAPSVTVKGGDMIEANHVIITASLGVLKSGSIRFSPPLLSQKHESICRLGFGKVEKVFFGFSDAAWLALGQLGISNMNILISPPQASGWISRTTGFFRAAGTNYAYMWVAGAAACAEVASASDEQLISDLQEWLIRFYPEGGAALRASSVVRSTWSCNDLTLGSYSFLAKGSTSRDIGTLADPLGASNQVLFAGEATHPNHFGTIHGAFQTGVREAERVLGTVVTSAK